jgi:pentatricopeptide repeat protein
VSTHQSCVLAYFVTALAFAHCCAVAHAMHISVLMLTYSTLHAHLFARASCISTYCLRHSEAMYAECTVALCQRGRWQRGKDLLREATAAIGVPLAAAPHTAIIRAAGKSGHWRAALALLKEMESGMNKVSLWQVTFEVTVCCTGSTCFSSASSVFCNSSGTSDSCCCQVAVSCVIRCSCRL